MSFFPTPVEAPYEECVQVIYENYNCLRLLAPVVTSGAGSLVEETYVMVNGVLHDTGPELEIDGKITVLPSPTVCVPCKSMNALIFAYFGLEAAYPILDWAIDHRRIAYLKNALGYEYDTTLETYTKGVLQ